MGFWRAGLAFFAEGCGRRVSENERMSKGLVEGRVGEGASEMSEDELLLEDVYWVGEEEDRREAVFKVYEDKGRNAGGAYLLVEKRCRKVHALICGGHGVFGMRTRRRHDV